MRHISLPHTVVVTHSVVSLPEPVHVVGHTRIPQRQILPVVEIVGAVASEISSVEGSSSESVLAGLVEVTVSTELPVRSGSSKTGTVRVGEVVTEFLTEVSGTRVVVFIHVFRVASGFDVVVRLVKTGRLVAFVVAGVVKSARVSSTGYIAESVASSIAACAVVEVTAESRRTVSAESLLLIGVPLSAGEPVPSAVRRSTGRSKGVMHQSVRQHIAVMSPVAAELRHTVVYTSVIRHRISVAVVGSAADTERHNSSVRQESAGRYSQ